MIQTLSKLSKTIVFILLISILTILTSNGDIVRATSGWNAGSIITDSVFTNVNSMSVSQIQQFLDSKVANCDTYGAQTSEYGGGTRSQWAANASLHPKIGAFYAPFTCLKNYSENGLSAAQIIYNAAQRYTINPKVLIVLLQKEQGLVTDTWPGPHQYKTATGYGCPDTSVCDSDYFGFTNQVNWAAHMYRAVMNDSPTWSKKYYPYWVADPNTGATGPRYIAYSPSDNCSGSWVNITNRATQALYNYTPYQPNSAAINAPMGVEVNCGAYGNLNFFQYYTSWFESTQDSSPLNVTNITTNSSIVGIGQAVNVSYSITNPNNYSISVPSIGVSNRLDGSFYDFNISTNINFTANETKTFTGTFYPNKTGVYSLSVAYNMFSTWWGGNISYVTVKLPTLSIVKPINVSPEFPLVGSAHTINFKIKNTGDVEADLTHLMVADIPLGYKSDERVIIQPGSTYDYQAVRTSIDTIQQSAWISYMLSNGDWYGLGNRFTFKSYLSPASVSITKGLSISPSDPVVGRPIESSLTIHNFGDQPIRYNNIGIRVTRNSDGARFDYSSQPDGASIVIYGKSDYLYKSSRILPTKDQYSYQVTESIDGKDWSSDFIGGSNTASKTSTIQTYNTPANIVITSPLTIHTIKQGEIVTLTYSVKNIGDQPTGDTTIAFSCMLNNQYCDISGDTINLKHNETATVTRIVSFTTAGNLIVQPLRYWHGVWENFDNMSSSQIQVLQPDQNTFTTTLNLNSTAITLGQSLTATYTIKNNTNVNLQIPRFAVAARLDGFYDFGLQNWFFIKANETLTFTAHFTPTKKGTYTLFPVSLLNGEWTGYKAMYVNVQ